MTETVVQYDPTMAALVANAEDDWGADPEANHANLIPYGIAPIDQALYGFDINGEVILIQGPEKRRKSTLVDNIVVNVQTGEKPKDKPMINLDSLEPGKRPGKYRDTLLSIVATRWILKQGHAAHGHCKVCGNSFCREIGITPKFLKYNKRSPLQLRAIDYALDSMRDWPVLIHGAHLEEGNTRALAEAYNPANPKDLTSRWVRLYHEYGMKFLVIDHVQQYAWADDPNDYEKQIRAVGAAGDFSAQYGVVVVIVSQVSLGSQRDVKQNGGRLVAAGGSKAAQEANTVFSVNYESGSGEMTIKIEESRDAGNLIVKQPLEDESGAFYGIASTNLD